MFKTRAAFELHEFAQKPAFAFREQRERVARRLARQGRQKGDHRHFDQVMFFGAALAGIANPLKKSAEFLHILFPNTALRCCFGRKIAPCAGNEKQEF